MCRSDLSDQMLVAVILLFALSLSGLEAQAQADTTKQVRPLKIEKDFEITAGLENPVWKKAPSSYIKHQIQPNDNAPAPVETEVKVLYSRSSLYIGFICEDPNPQKIRANVSDRDNSFQDDFVGVFIDPFNNNQQAYQLFVNPLGIQMDGMLTGNSGDANFDMLWDSKAQITNSGYEVVMKIPFKSLNFPKRKIQNWSIQFVRNYPRSNRYQLTWSDVKLNNSCLLCQNGRLQGMEGVESSNTVELLPYGMSYQSSELNNPGNPSSGLDHGRINGRVGGSVRYSPTSSTSLHGVVNPDFSQVETDAAQIGANETFALYYPEKRPFFMKGSDLFDTSENLFYSRMINHPIAAGKVTHQTSNYSVAFLTAYDRNTPFIVPGRYGSSLIRSEKDSYSNVLRGKYSLGSESYIGGLLTTRNQQNGENYVGSIDWNFRLADNYYFSGQAAYSDTKEMNDSTLYSETRRFGQSSYDAAFNGEQFGGSLINAEFSREAKYYNFSLEYSAYSPTFQSQVGFINQTDSREIEARQSLSYYPDNRFLSRGRLSVSGTLRYDFKGQLQERYIFARLSNSFGGQTNLSVSYLPVNEERFQGRYFTQMNRMMIDARTNPLDALSFRGHIDFGKEVYRSSDPKVGKGYNISAGATVKPTSRLELNLSYDYSTLSSYENGRNFYSGDIFRMKGRYNFTKKIFARLITQYNSFNEQIQVYPLLSYKANPFTKLYIGMTDYMNHFDRPGSSSFSGYKETNRQFFVKFQYLIRS